MPKARANLADRMSFELEPARGVVSAPADRPAASPSAGYRQPSRQNVKRIQGHFSPRVKRQLRMLGVQLDKTEEQLVGEALNLLFQTHSIPAIAFEDKDAS